MNKIKDQVDSLVKFTATTIDALTDERSTIQDRLIEGIEKMKEAHIFTDEEIKEISKYTMHVLNNRFNNAKAAIINELRATFTF